MMRLVDDSAAESVGAPEPPTAGISGMLGLAAGFLRRRWRTLVICLLLSLPLGGLYYYAAPRTYTASATLLLEAQKAPLLDSLMGNAPRDVSWVDSQIGVIRSQNVAAYVVKQLRLNDDPQFYRGGLGPIDMILQAAGVEVSEINTDADRARAATAAVMGGLAVKRLGTSYMLQLDFVAHNPEHAIKVANAMVDGYVYDQLNAKYQSNRQASDWLQERLQALREQTANAERAVIEYKAKNNIVKTGGTLMNEKQLSDTSGAFAAARTRVADLQARLERITAVREAYQQEQTGSSSDETVSEAMSSAIIGQLRGRYLDAVNREADWSVRLGKNHVAVLNLRNQIRDIRRSIRDELGRIEETTKSEFQIAKKQQEEAEKAMTGLVSQSTATNQAQIVLFSLEAAAQSYRKLYDSFLQRHTETVQQQSLPSTDARLISQASINKVSPQKLQVAMLAILGGGMLGVGLGLFREMMDRGFRTRDQVRSILNVECLAMVPLLPKSGFRILREAHRGASSKMKTGLPATFAGVRNIHPPARVWRNIVDTPSSPYSEAIQSLKLSLDLHGSHNENPVIGMTSCLPGEGKTTMAGAMAASSAQRGARVLLIDCDVRNPSLTRALAPDAEVGFFEVVDGQAKLTDAVWHDPSTTMDFLPLVNNPAQPLRYDIFASNAAKSFFKTLQLKYDCVIVDLAPLVAGVDVQLGLRHVDSFVLVVEWGSTKIDEVQYALRHAPGVQKNLAGVVLNKVNMAAMSLYDRYGAQYYYAQPPRRAMN
jgi:succinoglycan biosynthesis transport protein ExoP